MDPILSKIETWVLLVKRTMTNSISTMTRTKVIPFLKLKIAVSMSNDRIINFMIKMVEYHLLNNIYPWRKHLSQKIFIVSMLQTKLIINQTKRTEREWKFIWILLSRFMSSLMLWTNPDSRKVNKNPTERGKMSHSYRTKIYFSI